MLRRIVPLSVLCLLVGVLAALPADEPSKGTSIFAEPAPLKPGGGLSIRTPVARPPSLSGVRSWTIETRRHRWAPIDLALSPDGAIVATSGYDGMVRLWDAVGGRLLRVLVGHDSYASGLAWSADGRYLASTGTFDYTVRVWEARTGLPVKVLDRLEGPPGVVAWSPDGSLLAAGTSGSGYVSIWRIATGTLVKTFGNGKPVLSLAFAPDGETLACGVHEVGVNFVTASDGKASGKIELTSQAPQALSYSADGKQLVVATSKQVLVWDLPGKKAIRHLDGATTTLARHGNRVAVSLPTGKIWDLETGKPGVAFPTGGKVCWSRDGKALFLLSGDDVVRVDADKGTEVKRWSVAGSGSLWWGPGRPFLSDVGTAKPRLWDGTSGKLLFALEGHTAATTTAAWSPGGKILATGGYDRIVHVWNPATGKLLRTLKGLGAATTALAVAGDGKIAVGMADGKVAVFAPEATTPLKVLAGHTDAVRALAWSKEGRLASGGLDAAVRLWALESAKPLRSLEHAGSIECLAFAPSGKHLAAGASEHRVRIWTHPGGKMVREFTHLGSPPAVSALAWSPDSSQLFSGRANHTAQLWDLKLGKDRQNLAVMAPVQQVASAAGGKTLVTCTIDRCVRFWSAGTGRIQTTVVAEGTQLSCITSDGHARVANEDETELVYVVLTAKGMDTYAGKEFASRHGWKNVPAKARFTGN